MPATLSYPGVYIEEIGSGVRTIRGVATSITAFIGRTVKGASNDPVSIHQFSDFERQFGPVRVNYDLGFAVRDYYLNGGKTAVIVRVNKDAKAATVDVGCDTNKATFEAASEGTWGNKVSVTIAHLATLPVTMANAGIDARKAFSVMIVDDVTKQKEVFQAVTVEPGPFNAKSVMKSQSNLVRITALGLDRPPVTSSQQLAGGDDGRPPGAHDLKGKESDLSGIYALNKLLRIGGLFNLLCIPNSFDEACARTLAAAAIPFCSLHRAMYLMNPPSSWTNTDEAVKGIANDIAPKTSNAAIFFPRLTQRHPEVDSEEGKYAPCGAVAGVFARTDTRRGVWKAPAGLEANLIGVPELSIDITDDENGDLNAKGVNCLRSFPVAGRVVWGSRTLLGDDTMADEYKYIPVRRTALFIEESLYQGTQWAAFEPNDEPLWEQLRFSIGAFMNNLFRQGAFQGQSAREAYYVKCDKETTTQTDINLGVVNIHVGFAPLKSAEFVVLKIQQTVGNIPT